MRILTEPDASLCAQYQALLRTEGLELTYVPSGVRRIAEVAFQVNERTENIGARRLHTVMERLLEQVSFDATDGGARAVTVDAAYVDRYLGELVKDEDLTTIHSLRLQATGYRLQATGYRLQATGYRLQATGYRLQATGYR